MIKQIKHELLGDINVWSPGDSFLEHDMFQMEINSKCSVPNYFFDIGAKYFSIYNCIEAHNANNYSYSFVREICSKYVRRMLSKLTIVGVVLKDKSITPDMFSIAIEKGLRGYSESQIKYLSDLYVSLQPCVLCNHIETDEKLQFVCSKGMKKRSKMERKFNKCDGFESVEYAYELRDEWKDSIDKFRSFLSKFENRKVPYSMVFSDDKDTPWFYLDVIDRLSKTDISEFNFLKD